MPTSSSYGYGYALHNNSSSSISQRGLAMVLALVSAVVLSPLYVDRRNDLKYRYETKWSSGFLLPVVLAGLIVAIKTTSAASSSSSSSNRSRTRTNSMLFPPSEPSSVLKIGSSSWGLAGILVMLMFIMSWQSSMQHFLWR